MTKIVLRIGGSILGSPPDGRVMASYAAVVEDVVKKGHRVAIVVGGGSVARQYIEAAASLGLPHRDQDRIAIQASRLNAKLVGMRLGYPDVPTTIGTAVARVSRDGVVVMGGLRPGITTDTVATLLAGAWRSDVMIKASNQDGIYTADPRKHRDARLLPRVSYETLVEILGGVHAPGIHSIVDPVAVEMIAEHRLRLVVVNGDDPENVLSAVLGKPVGTKVG
ncbi:MAG: UMP kinase [Nitrososphaerales archaeon]